MKSMNFKIFMLDITGKERREGDKVLLLLQITSVDGGLKWKPCSFLKCV